MPRSNTLRSRDLLAIHRLVGECRELGDDPTGWRLHLGRGLCRMTGAGFALTAEMDRCLRGPRRDLGTAVWGLENGFDVTGWARMLSGFHRNPLYNPLMNAYIERLGREPGVCLARSEMIGDREWYGSDYYREAHRVLGADATVCCFRPVAGRADEYSEVFLGRRAGERDFSAWDRAVVREAMAAVGPMVGGPLARFGEPSPAELSPRVRDVLRRLLEGDSDKQIAVRLRISPHTVNQYVKVIYRHFGVRSRPELLARWIRRGWGATFAWTE